MNRLLAVLSLALALSAACSQQPAKDQPPPPAPNADQTPSAPAAQPPAAKEHVFRGKVEQVDATAKTLTVNGEAVEGWMGAMTMVYSPDKPEVITRIKAGDQITAKVFDGDFGTLHDVQVVPPK